MEDQMQASISGRLRGSNSLSPGKSVGSNSGSNRECDIANIPQSPTTKIEGGEEETKNQQISNLTPTGGTQTQLKNEHDNYSPINLDKYRYGFENRDRSVVF